MTKDFRASQIQTNKIISSGSTGTGAKILVYPITAQNNSNPNQGVINPSVFNTSSIGSDTFMFVSGGINSKDNSTNQISVYGGDVHISGNLSHRQEISNSFQADYGERSIYTTKLDNIVNVMPGYYGTIGIPLTYVLPVLITADLGRKIQFIINPAITKPLVGIGAINAPTVTISASQNDKILFGGQRSYESWDISPGSPIDASSTGSITLTPDNERPIFVDLIAAPTGTKDPADTTNYWVAKVSPNPQTTFKTGISLATTGALATHTSSSFYFFQNQLFGSPATATIPITDADNKTAHILTATSNGSLFIDDLRVYGGQYVLIKDESTLTKNGVYFVSSAGNFSHPWILVRQHEANNPGHFPGGGAFIGVISGSANAGKIFYTQNYGANWNTLNVSGSGTAITVKNQGVTISTTIDTLNFTGSNVSVTAVGNTATIAISGNLVPVSVSESYQARVGDMVYVSYATTDITISAPTNPSEGDKFGVMAVNTNGSNAIAVDFSSTFVFPFNESVSVIQLQGSSGQSQIYQFATLNIPSPTQIWNIVESNIDIDYSAAETIVSKQTALTGTVKLFEYHRHSLFQGIDTTSNPVPICVEFKINARGGYVAGRTPSYASWKGTADFFVTNSLTMSHIDTVFEHIVKTGEFTGSNVNLSFATSGAYLQLYGTGTLNSYGISGSDFGNNWTGKVLVKDYLINT